MTAEITQWIVDATGGPNPGRDGLVRGFAERAETSPSNVSRWREGKIPGPKFRVGLAHALGRSEDEIESACQFTSVDGQPSIEHQLTEIVTMLTELTTRVADQHADLKKLLPPDRRGRRASS